MVIVSNRGPVSFAPDPEGGPGDVVARRGAGGLVSGLGPLVRDTGSLWIAAAMTDGDRLVAARGTTEAEGFRVRLLDIEPDRFAAYYDGVCNEALWFTHHGLFDPVYEPAWPPGWVEGPWAAYREVNRAMADAVVAEAEPGAVVLVQDYHLCLVARLAADRRPDLRWVHFSHTPFAPADGLRVLPPAVRHELIEGMAAHHACGFHSARWAADFLECCEVAGLGAPTTFVAPLGLDAADLEASAGREAAVAAGAELDRLVGDRALLVRVDRIELSKNLLRGFDAYAAMLEAEPSWRQRVVFAAFCYPSRQGVAAYDRYARAVADRVAEINERFGTEGWTPILYDARDDYPRSLAALARADALLVNPIRDGLNLVAMEAMVLNRRDGQLVLSPEAGCWDLLGDAGAYGADPFDVGATAAALAAALGAAAEERARRAASLRAAASAATTERWLAAQLDAAG
jgi:trehalose 6-phosphate synthase